MGPLNSAAIHKATQTSIWGASYITDKKKMSSRFRGSYIAAKHYEQQRSVQFRPCIDIHKGKVKQIVGSTLHDHPDLSSSLITNFETEKTAADFARVYQKDGLYGGHVIMLGADDGSRNAALEALAAFPGGLQVGGGITADNANFFLDCGASHVIVTSFIFSDGQLDTGKLRELVGTVGRSNLVLDLSCRKKDSSYVVVTQRWQKYTDLELSERTLEILAEYADEFLIHGVDVEGKRLGIDEDLVSLLGKYSPIPVTYAGGAASIGDLERIRLAGCGAVNVTVGSALDIFGGDLPYVEVVQWHASQARNIA